MKVLFLDIDGVLNGCDFNTEAESSTLDRRGVERLNRVLRETGAMLVLSSSWRYTILSGDLTVVGFDYLLRTHGVLKGRLVGHTCSDEEVPDRGRQIRRWVAEHGNVSEWAVVDDLNLDLAGEDWRQVQPDRRRGLTDEDAAALIRILGPRPRTSAGAPVRFP